MLLPAQDYIMQHVLFDDRDVIELRFHRGEGKSYIAAWLTNITGVVAIATHEKSVGHLKEYGADVENIIYYKNVSEEDLFGQLALRRAKIIIIDESVRLPEDYKKRVLEDASAIKAKVIMLDSYR